MPDSISVIASDLESASIIPSTTPLLSSNAGPTYDSIPPAPVAAPAEEKKSSAYAKFWTANSYWLSAASVVLLIIASSVLQYFVLIYNLPDLDPDHRAALKFPRSLADLRALNVVLSVYIENHYAKVMIVFVSSYIYLQSFSIPGSMWLSILAGALFNFWVALIVVCFCSATGATVAYLISFTLGSVFIKSNLSTRLAIWHRNLAPYRSDLFFYTILLRISPIPPNWFVNIAAPHLGFPLGAFFWGTVFGVAAPSFLHVNAGAALNRLGAEDELRIVTPLNVLMLTACAVVVTVPLWVRRKWGGGLVEEVV